MLKVIKKDGTSERWNPQKIKDAVMKASLRANASFTEEMLEVVVKAVKSMITSQEISTTELHTKVIAALRGIYEPVANSYQEYRDYKNTYAKEFEKLKETSENTIFLGDRENANFDSSLISTQGSLIKGYLTKSLYKQFYLSKKEKEYVKRGDIYIHDLRDMIFGSINCCLFDMTTVLKDGFEMSNIKYTEPKSVLTALQVIGDITLVASSQQFGGFTIPEIDKVLLPYCKKTWKNAYDEAYATFPYCEHENAASYADNVLERELRQGFQSLELKLNTIPSSRGDFAFTTLTFGQWDVNLPIEDREFLSKIGSTILETRMKGHGGKQVVFPKLVYLYDKNQIKADIHSQELFNEAVKCSSQCMYPDYLSLTGDPEHNVVAKTYLEHGVITSPMG